MARKRMQPDTAARYIPYARAMSLLAARLGATPEELAAWIFLGPRLGGVAAYVNANELDPPPSFTFALIQNHDYLAPLMASWFLEGDIVGLTPEERFITGATLIERWSRQPHIQVEAFIRAKIEESRLVDMHPITGHTQGTNRDDSGFPPIEQGLFSMTEILAIESDDFGAAVGPDIGTPEWRRQNAITAANALHDKPGGSRDKREQIRAIWATGKFQSRDVCAEQECGGLGMSLSAARRALINTPNPVKRGTST